MLLDVWFHVLFVAELRVSWMDLCAMRSIAPSFVSQRVLRPLGPEVSRLISVCSAQMMRVQYASNNALSKDQNERVTAQSHASAHGFEFACDFVSSQPHRAIAAGPKWMRSCRQACVIGDFEYFHYLQVIWHSVTLQFLRCMSGSA